jgi:hypothetical protein
LTTTEQLTLWVLIVSGATLLVYLGQLIVLILVYFRVIKETDRNAEIRRHEIERAGEILQETFKNTGQQLNVMAKRNTIGMALMSLLLAVMAFTNDARIRKLERNNPNGVSKH